MRCPLCGRERFVAAVFAAEAGLAPIVAFIHHEHAKSLAFNSPIRKPPA